MIGSEPPDPYETLGIDRDADEVVIKSAYRRLAKDCHPDLNQGHAGLAEQFRRVTEAYETLIDRDRRSAFDERRRQDRASAADAADAEDVEAMFARRPPPRPPRGPPPRSQPASARPGFRPAPSTASSDRWVETARRRAAWERASLVLLVTAGVLATGSLVVRVLYLLLAAMTGHDGMLLALLLAILGFATSLKLWLVVFGMYIRERGHDGWSAGASTLAIALVLLGPFGLSVHLVPAFRLPDAEVFASSAVPEPPSAAGTGPAGPAGTGDTLPPVPRDQMRGGPAPGLSVPNQALLRRGFAGAESASAYAQQFYKIVFRQTIDGQPGSLSFTESLLQLYAGVPAADLAQAQAFTYEGSPGYLVYRAGADGRGDGILHWDDYGLDLAVHVQGMPAASFTAQDLFETLAAVKRTAAAPPADAAMPARAAPPPAAKSDPCGIGTICYDRAHYGHHWFIRRGRGSDHPS